MIATQGTDLAGAIELSSKSFTQQDKVGRAILIITDGEDHEGGAIEAAEKHVRMALGFCPWSWFNKRFTSARR